MSADNIWQKIPSFLRWILLFPICLVIVFVSGILIRITVLSGGMPLTIFNLIFPAIMGLIALSSVYYFAPALKTQLVLFFTILRGLLIPLLLFGKIYTLSNGIETTGVDGWIEIIAEIITLLCSIWLYYQLKEIQLENEITYPKNTENS